MYLIESPWFALLLPEALARQSTQRNMRAGSAPNANAQMHGEVSRTSQRPVAKGACPVLSSAPPLVTGLRNVPPTICLLVLVAAGFGLFYWRGVDFYLGMRAL